MFAAKNAMFAPWENPTLDALGIANSAAPGTATIASLAATQVIKGNCVVAMVNTFAYTVVTSMTCGATNMTLAGASVDDNTVSDGGMQMYYLLNSGVGQSLKGTQTVTASWSGTKPSYAGLFTMSFFDVHVVSGFGSSFSTGAGAKTKAITSTVGGIVVGGASNFAALSNPPLSAYVGTLGNAGTVLGSFFQMLSGYTKATTTSTNVGATMAGGSSADALMGMCLS